MTNIKNIHSVMVLMYLKLKGVCLMMALEEESDVHLRVHCVRAINVCVIFDNSGDTIITNR